MEIDVFVTIFVDFNYDSITNSDQMPLRYLSFMNSLLSAVISVTLQTV